MTAIRRLCRPLHCRRCRRCCEGRENVERASWRAAEGPSGRTRRWKREWVTKPSRSSSPSWSVRPVRHVHLSIGCPLVRPTSDVPRSSATTPAEVHRELTANSPQAPCSHPASNFQLHPPSLFKQAHCHKYLRTLIPLSSPLFSIQASLFYPTYRLRPTNHPETLGNSCAVRPGTPFLSALLDADLNRPGNTFQSTTPSREGINIVASSTIGPKGLRPLAVGGKKKTRQGTNLTF